MALHSLPPIWLNYKKQETEARLFLDTFVGEDVSTGRVGAQGADCASSYEQQGMTLYYLPNAITVFRIGLVPVFILFLDDRNYAWALGIFVLAGVSDSLDGFIAKRYNLVTQIGAILDPLADKILLVTAYIMLVILEHVPLWLVLTVGFRDLLIVSGYLAYTSLIGPMRLRPSYLSKLNTFMQITLVVYILSEQAGLLPVSAIDRYLVYAVFLTTVSSGLHYAWVWGAKRHPENHIGQP